VYQCPRCKTRLDLLNNKTSRVSGQCFRTVTETDTATESCVWLKHVGVKR